MMNINEVLCYIIEEKYRSLQDLQAQERIFAKINFFEGNAVGQIGEKFIKTIVANLKIPLDDDKETRHDEFDILSNGKKIEIKTARKGLKNDTFQFNGINPRYQYDHIILLGISASKVGYRILDKNDIFYGHSRGRNYYAKIENKEKQLVRMNPNSEVNFKLTLNIKELKNIELLENELQHLFLKSN